MAALPSLGGTPSGELRAQSRLGSAGDGRRAGGAAQYHTWCWSIPLGRWAAAYDWLADSPDFKDFDHAAAADVLIDAIHSQVYPRILARQPAGDNQIGSMLLACGLVGYLFCAGVDFLAEFGLADDQGRLAFWAGYPECNTKGAARRALEHDSKKIRTKKVEALR